MASEITSKKVRGNNVDFSSIEITSKKYAEMTWKFAEIWSLTYRRNIHVEPTSIRRGVPAGLSLLFDTFLWADHHSVMSKQKINKSWGNLQNILHAKDFAKCGKPHFKGLPALDVLNIFWHCYYSFCIIFAYFYPFFFKCSFCMICFILTII